ncbi:MAG: hypothetical protein IT529_01015 [Burkholderiales bacterium]|nr:hypothetical protein [Burkholderiales bacterium]
MRLKRRDPTEIRDEAREARAQTRENFKNVFHVAALAEIRPGLVEPGVNDVIAGAPRNVPGAARLGRNLILGPVPNSTP